MTQFKFVFWLALLAPVGTAQVVIVNGASFRAEQPISAGSWAAAFGTFTGVTTTTASSFPLPTTLASVKVTIDGVDAPLYDVRATQLTFLIPYATKPGIRPVQISIGATNITGNLRVMSSSPAVFIKDTATPPRAAALNQDGLTENSSSSPARRGEIVSIYGTGPGALTAQPTDGAIPGSSPLISTVSKPQVYIGGVEADVQFSGLNPGAPGLWQLNVIIPNQAFIKGRVPVRIYVDGVDSNEVTLFVQ
jgi:uncharacterized protein (TIGR03437 family)